MTKILAACLGLAAVLLLPGTVLAQATGPTLGAPPAGGVATVQMAVVSIATAGAGLPALRATFDDWQVRCEASAEGAGEHCALMQAVVAEAPKGIGLSVIVLNAATPNTRMVRILAPLGVLLPAGLGLRIDDGDVGVTGFARCLPNGCVAEVALDDTLLAKFKKGNRAIFVVFRTPDQAIGIPISLKGFSRGLEALL